MATNADLDVNVVDITSTTPLDIDVAAVSLVGGVPIQGGNTVDVSIDDGGNSITVDDGGVPLDVNVVSTGATENTAARATNADVPCAVAGTDYIITSLQRTGATEIVKAKRATLQMISGQRSRGFFFIAKGVAANIAGTATATTKTLTEDTSSAETNVVEYLLGDATLTGTYDLIDGKWTSSTGDAFDLNDIDSAFNSLTLATDMLFVCFRGTKANIDVRASVTAQWP